MSCLCKICGNVFEANKNWHHPAGLCSPECRQKQSRIVKNRYKKTAKGIASNRRWIKSDKRRQNEKKYSGSDKARKLAILRKNKYLKNHPERAAEFALREKSRRRWLLPENRENNRIARRKYQKSKKGRWQKKTYKYLLRNNVSGKINRAGWESKCRRLKFKCQVCKKTLLKNEITIDHIIPLSLGGTNEIENLQPLCRSCNCSKGRRILPNVQMRLWM